MADATDINTDSNREKGALHRPAASIDAGKPNNGDGNTIINPPTTDHLARPGIDATIPAGQVSKM